MTAAEVRDLMLRHMIEYVEQPHPAFGGLPVCPFSKPARLAGKIDMRVLDFFAADLPALVRAFAAQDAFEMAQFMHAGPALDPAALKRIVDGLLPVFAECRLAAFTGHPDEVVVRAGVPLRPEPVPMIQAVPIRLVKDRSARLPPRYWANWSAAEKATSSLGFDYPPSL